MPTHEETPTFLRDYGRLTNTQEKRLEAALSQFIADLRAIEAGKQAWFRPGYASNGYAGSRAPTR